MYLLSFFITTVLYFHREILKHIRALLRTRVFLVLLFHAKYKTFVKRVKSMANNMKFIFGHSSVFARVIHKFFNVRFMRIKNEGNMKIDHASGMYSGYVCVYIPIAKI